VTLLLPMYLLKSSPILWLMRGSLFTGLKPLTDAQLKELVDPLNLDNDDFDPSTAFGESCNKGCPICCDQRAVLDLLPPCE